MQTPVQLSHSCTALWFTAFIRKALKKTNKKINGILENVLLKYCIVINNANECKVVQNKI